jgi:hypothetical protein
MTRRENHPALGACAQALGGVVRGERGNIPEAAAAAENQWRVWGGRERRGRVIGRVILLY